MGSGIVSVEGSGIPRPKILVYWVAVKELNLSYYIGKTLLFTIYIYIYTQYGKFLKSNPVLRFIRSSGSGGAGFELWKISDVRTSLLSGLQFVEDPSCS